MKKLISLILITFLALFTLVACGDNTVNVEGITLNKNELSLEVDSSFTLEATILPDNATNKSVEWSSNNVQVATVTSGIVTAVSKGEAIISAKTANGEFTATCKVIVNNKKPVTKFNNLNYVAFGDSITFGQDGTNNGVQLENPYPKLLAEALGFNSYNNMGISGATLCLNDKVVCMTDIITSYTSSADVISVMLGVNDFSRSLPLGTIEDNSNQSIFGALNKIATHFKTNYPNAFVFFMTPYQMQVGNRNSYTVNSQGYNLEDVANAVKQVAENFGYPVVDMFNNGNFEAEMYSTQSDGLHPSQQFYIDYTVPQLVEFLEENYGKEPAPEAPIDFSNLTMACIGDSITYGFCGDHSKPAFTYNYPAVVKSLLSLKNVSNLGSCGSLLSRHENTAYTSMIDKIDLISKNTNIISVFGGINDFATCVDLGNINSTNEYCVYGSLNKIAYRLKTEYSNSFVFFITPLPLSNSSLEEINNSKYQVEDIVNAVKQVGEKYDIPVLDLFNKGVFNPETDSFDGCHPTETCYRYIIAPQIVEFIEENYGKEPIPEEPLEPIDFSDLTYLAFGDSITEGAGLENKGYSYPSQVGNILGCQVTNKGVSGSSLAYDSSRHCIAYDVMQNTKLGGKYDIISVTGGSNDKALALPLGTINDNTYNTIYGSLNVIADSLKTTYPNAFIFFMTPIKNPTCDVINSENYNLLDICNAIKQVASKYNFPVLDLYNTSQYESVDCGMYAQGSDGWHPHKEFILQYMAPQIVEFIKENYGKEPTPEAPIDFSNLTMACLGDSITNNPKRDLQYCDKVKETLNLKGCFNYGISATTMTQNYSFNTPMCDRVYNVSTESDIISIMFGTNDCGFSCELGTIQSEDIKTFYGSYKYVIETLQKRCPTAFIFLMTPLQNHSYNEKTTNVNSVGYHLRDYANAVKEIASYYNLPCLDLYLTSGFENNFYKNGADGVHPSQIFIDNTLSPKIAQFIQDNYKPKA